MLNTQIREHAHRLIEFVSEDKVSAIISMLEAELTPLQRTMVDLPLDDEPAKPMPYQAATIAHEDILAEFGIAADGLNQSPEKSAR